MISCVFLLEPLQFLQDPESCLFVWLVGWLGIILWDGGASLNEELSQRDGVMIE